MLVTERTHEWEIWYADAEVFVPNVGYVKDEWVAKRSYIDNVHQKVRSQYMRLPFFDLIAPPEKPAKRRPAKWWWEFWK